MVRKLALLFLTSGIALKKNGHEKKISTKAGENPSFEVAQNPLEARYVVTLPKISPSLTVIACSELVVGPK